MHDHVVRLLLDRNAWIADDDLDSVGLQVGQQSSSRLWLLKSQESRPCLDDRHLRAEPRESLRQLDANRAAAHHDQSRRQLARHGSLAVGPVVDLVQAFDGRDRGGAPVGDDHRLARHELLAADLDRPQVDHLARAADQLRARLLEGGGRSRVIEVARHPKHALRQQRKRQDRNHRRHGGRQRPCGVLLRGDGRGPQRLRLQRPFPNQDHRPRRHEGRHQKAQQHLGRLSGRPPGAIQ